MIKLEPHQISWLDLKHRLCALHNYVVDQHFHLKEIFVTNKNIAVFMQSQRTKNWANGEIITRLERKIIDLEKRLNDNTGKTTSESNNRLPEQPSEPFILAKRRLPPIEE
jgi:hypothetical protein